MLQRDEHSIRQEQCGVGTTCDNSCVYIIIIIEREREVLSTCPLHTISGCGKERRIILIGPWHGDLTRQHSFGTTLRFTGPVPADSRQ